ncbi:hypothetical protein LINPERHAP2_LOCUS3586 [Linum perenne]
MKTFPMYVQRLTTYLVFKANPTYHGMMVEISKDEHIIVPAPSTPPSTRSSSLPSPSSASYSSTTASPAVVGALTTFPDVSSSFPAFSASLEELVLIDNPDLVIPLSSVVSNFTSLRRLVVIGNGVYDHLPEKIRDLVNLEEITLSRNLDWIKK